MSHGGAGCPLCGAALDEAAAAGCRGCPLGPRCGMKCCPVCGYTWVDPEQSSMGRLLRGWFRGRGGRHGRRHRAPTTLAEVPVGWKARLRDWELTPPQRRRQLRAYGVSESVWLHVLQHAPTTVIRVHHTELAIEHDLAATILVEAAQPEDFGPRRRRFWR